MASPSKLKDGMPSIPISSPSTKSSLPPPPGFLPEVKSSAKASPKIGKSNKITIPAGNNPFQKHLFGDVFGTRSLGDARSMLGILYRARVQENMHAKRKENALDDDTTDVTTNLVGTLSNVADVMDSDSDDDLELNSEMNSRLQLAVTIRNWSSIEGNNPFVIREGGVHALIALATIDDQAIRKCVASAFYHLSNRKENRQDLITLGAVQGVIITTQGLRSWKIAKLSAFTLCNLSMEEESHAMAIMAQEGAITALGLLFGLRQQRLLPVCVQALYNMTCAEHFKGMERILKSLINIPQTGFDSSYYFVKALVNCCRFYWMRSRIIEDGALPCLWSFVNNIPSKTNTAECAYLVAVSLRLLSENSSSAAAQLNTANQSQIRIDMVGHKGNCIDNLNVLMPYCDELSWEHVIVTLFNLLQVPPVHIADSTYEVAISMVIDIISKSKSENTLLVCSACMYMASKEFKRFIERPNIPIKIAGAMPVLLASPNALTKYFSIAGAGYLFFSNPLKSNSLDILLKNVVEAGPDAMNDDKAAHAVAIFLANLSDNNRYMSILHLMGLCEKVIDLMLLMVKEKNSDMVVQESLVLGIVRIALQLKEIPSGLPTQIANMMFELLSLRDLFVLRNTIYGIRCLGENGICHNELLSDEFLQRVANIVVRYHDDKILVENCLAVLAVFSYDEASHNGLSEDGVMSVLFKAAISEKNISSRVLVATALCNISADERVRTLMVDKGVVEVLSNLSGATSELIQELCAKCICNITASLEQHDKIIKHGILQTLMMISSVRAVANTTKQLCARALLNLLDENNIEALKQAGAVRVFATLSAIDNLPIQNICARAFLIFTGSESMREDIVSRLPVIHAIFGMVKCSSLRVNVMVGLAVSNLLVCQSSQKAAISAGGLSVLKIIASMDIDELTEATARVIVNLILEPSLHPYLLRESLVPVLVLFLQHPSRTAFECSLHALSCMAQYEIFHDMMIDKGCVTALVGALMGGRIIARNTATELCRCLCLLSYSIRKAEAMITYGNIMIAPHIIYRNGTCTAQAATMMALLFRNLSFDRSMHRIIMEHDVLRLLKCLYADFKTECAGILRASITFMNNIAHDHTMHQELLKQGMMNIMQAIVNTSAEYSSTRKYLHKPHPSTHHGHGHVDKKESSPRQHFQLYTRSLSLKTAMNAHSNFGNSKDTARHANLLDESLPDEKFDPHHTKYLILTKKDVYYMARTLNLVATSAVCHESIVEGSAVSICDHLLADDAMTYSRHEVAAALCSLSSSKVCRKSLVDQGASELLVGLARTAEIKETQRICGLALGYLSEISHVTNDVVGTVLLLNLSHEESLESNDLSSSPSRSDDSHANTGGKPLASLPPGTPGAPASAAAAGNGTASSGAAAATPESGHKNLRAMIKEGLLHRKEHHSVAVESANQTPMRSFVNPAADHLTLADYGLPELGAQLELKMTIIEQRFLQGHYNIFKFSTITLRSTPQAAGMVVRSASGRYLNGQGNMNVMSSGSAERDLEPPDRLEELRQLIRTWVYIREPLPKDMGNLGEYFGDENMLSGDGNGNPNGGSFNSDVTFNKRNGNSNSKSVGFANSANSMNNTPRGKQGNKGGVGRNNSTPNDTGAKKGKKKGLSDTNTTSPVHGQSTNHHSEHYLLPTHAHQGANTPVAPGSVTPLPTHQHHSHGNQASNITGLNLQSHLFGVSPRTAAQAGTPSVTGVNASNMYNL